MDAMPEKRRYPSDYPCLRKEITDAIRIGSLTTLGDDELTQMSTFKEENDSEGHYLDSRAKCGFQNKKAS